MEPVLATRRIQQHHRSAKDQRKCPRMGTRMTYLSFIAGSHYRYWPIGRKVPSSDCVEIMNLGIEAPLFRSIRHLGCQCFTGTRVASYGRKLRYVMDL